ncbi:MAG TPA: hypothetical protein VGO34_04125 [Alphaproteobacteria bacterium]|jgi:hypothetical protein
MGTNARAAAADWYLAFAEWRADIQRRTDAWRTVKFFRQSRSHTILWTEVMRGHYTGAPPGVTDCVAAMPCARMTARKIIALAEQKGYFLRRVAAGDSRRKLLLPSPTCVAEYEAMVDEFLHLADRLAAARPIVKGGGDKRRKTDRAKL